MQTLGKMIFHYVIGYFENNYATSTIYLFC